MTSFDLLDLIGRVDERHLEPSFPQKRRVRWKRWGALAACLVLAVGAAVLWNPEPGPQLQARPGTDASTPGTSAQEPVDVKNLLYGFREGEYSNQVLTINQISLGDNTAEYHKLEVRSQVELRDYQGEALEEVPGWYYLEGHEDLQYLIGPDGDGELALWEFAYFVPEEGETYSYRTVRDLLLPHGAGGYLPYFFRGRYRTDHGLPRQHGQHRRGEGRPGGDRHLCHHPPGGHRRPL